MWCDDYYDDDGGHWDVDNDEDKSKTQDPQSLNKRRALTHCLSSIKMVRLVCSRG